MSRLRDLGITGKLSFGFGLSLALIFVIGAISLVQLWGINALATRVTQVWLPELEVLGEVKRSMEEHRLLAMRRTTTTNFRQVAADAAERRQAQAAVDEGVLRYSALATRPAETALLGDFHRAWSDYLQSLDAVIASLDSGNPSGAQAEFDGRAIPAFDRAINTVDRLFDISKSEGRAATDNVRSVYWLSLVLIAGVLALSTLIVGAAVRWIRRNVSQPILRISTAMERITQGDRSVPALNGLGRTDEIGVLVSAATAYRDSLDRVRQLAEEADRERQRLDAALTNMSQGLCMFDPAGRLVVANPRFAEIYRLPAGSVAPGMPMSELMALAFGSKPDAAEDIARAMLLQGGLGSEHGGGSVVERLSDGRSISTAYRPMPGGGFVATFEDITERLMAEEKIRHLAHYDALTDLLNRVAFYEQMEAVLAHLRRSESIAILSLDLDHFKSVNDTLGHPIGDLLLQAVADRIRRSVRGEDIVARLGGDEFAIVQVPSKEMEDVTTLVTRLIEILGAPYQLEGHQVVVGISIGIAVAPADGGTPDVLMKNADLALYRAKADGGGVYRFFELEMDARMQARRALELDLRRALVNGEFELYYQPIIDLKSREITSCEALVRWHHPTRGLVPPADFISVAEATGLIVPLGEWVLRQACYEAARWPEPITVSVNLSPAQFKSRNLVPSVVNSIAASGLHPGRLELEITELVLLEESEGAFAVLHQLRDLGIRIAMDDFGTGYSSLGYLRSFPFDKIKIDQSFIRDLPHKEDSVAIVRAVVGLGSSLGITTTAEGVETTEQLASLTSEGCNEVQGFLFSRPRPAPDIMQMLRAQAPRAETAV